MPKQSKENTDFSGGLNSGVDPRDIADNELSDIKNMAVDQVGKVRTIGSLTTPTGVTDTIVANPTKSYGLFTFGSDYDMPSPKVINSVDNNGGQAEFDHDAAHGFSDGDRVLHFGFSESSYNGEKTVANAAAQTYETGDAYVSNVTGWAVKLDDTTNAHEDYIALAEVTYTNGISILPVSIDTWLEGIIDFTTITGLKAVYYYVDGALRVCDANFGASNVVEWFGYIERTHFSNRQSGSQNYSEVYSGWYPFNARIDKPTRGLAGDGILDAATDDANSTQTNLRSTEADAFAGMDTELDAGVYIAVSVTDYSEARIITARVDDDDVTTEALTGTWQNDLYRIYTPAGTGFTASLYSTAVTGTWTADELEFASTFIYDGQQESLPYEMSGNFTPTVDKELRLYVLCTRPFDARITGGRIYYRRKDSNEEWTLIADISLARGVRAGLDDNYKAWTASAVTGSGSAPSNSYWATTSVSHIDPPTLTYAALNGFSQNEESLEAKYKTATVLNRRVWIANVKVENESGDEVVMGDRIMYSPTGKFDTFPTSHYLDLGINDGDEFTALEGFADRLLAFKSEKLYIINVAQGSDTGWFLESQHSYMGVELPSAVFKTNFGIVWVNENGCFFYDGSTIRNLIEKVVNGIPQKVIDISTWATFVTSDVIVGFDPQYKQIIVVGDSDATAGNCYIYDMATMSWAKGDKFSQDANHKYTNFAILNNELIVGSYSD